MNGVKMDGALALVLAGVVLVLAILIWFRGMRSSGGIFWTSFIVVVAAIGLFAVSTTVIHLIFAAVMFIGAFIAAAIGGAVDKLEDILAEIKQANNLALEARSIPKPVATVERQEPRF